MKPASGPMLAILNGTNRFLMADLFTITLWNGTVLRWTSADTDIVLTGNTFSTSKEKDTAVPVVTRGKTKQVAGLEVDTLDITLGCGSNVLLGGVALQLAAANGAFDAALVQLERVFMATWGDTTPGSIILFSGHVAAVTPSSTTVALTCHSDLERLLVAMPRNTFAPNCTHVLFDTGCALNRASFQVSGAVSSTGFTPTTTTFRTNLTQADNYFSLGVLNFTSGALSGQYASVRSYVNAFGLTELSVPLPQAPANGDTFVIEPGCDKSQSTCTTKFSNLLHFRGFPYVPRNESTRVLGGV